MSRAFLFWFAFSMGPDTGARSGFPNISSNKSSTTARPESRRVLDHSPPRPFFSPCLEQANRGSAPRPSSVWSSRVHSRKTTRGTRDFVTRSRHHAWNPCGGGHTHFARCKGTWATGQGTPFLHHLTSLSLGTRVVVFFFPSCSSLFVFDCVSKISPWSKRIAAMQITSTGPARTGTEAFSCLDTSARFFVYSPGSPSS